MAIREADWKGAEAAFREAVRRTPKAAKPHRGLGIALLNQGKVDEGLATLQRSVAIEDSTSARYNIGFAYGKKGDYAKAAESFRLAVTLTPDYPLGRTYLVDALARSDRHDEALDTVKEARAKCAKCKAGTEFTRSLRPLALHHHNHAARLFAQGKLDLAEGGETVVLSMDPASPTPTTTWARSPPRAGSPRRRRRCTERRSSTTGRRRPAGRRRQEQPGVRDRCARGRARGGHAGSGGDRRAGRAGDRTSIRWGGRARR